MLGTLLVLLAVLVVGAIGVSAVRKRKEEGLATAQAGSLEAQVAFNAAVRALKSAPADPVALRRARYLGEALLQAAKLEISNEVDSANLGSVGADWNKEALMSFKRDMIEQAIQQALGTPSAH